jgi:hypothetical protein
LLLQEILQLYPQKKSQSNPQQKVPITGIFWYNVNMTIHFVVPKTKKEIELEKKQAECLHKHYITRCSHCGLIISSEHTEDIKPIKEVLL